MIDNTLQSENVEVLKARNETFEKQMGSQTGCAAKWFQSTLHLQNGLTQSCYNTPQHSIDTELLELTPAALHNTKEKAQQRMQMKNGEKPAGCEYCWRIESQNNGTLSDRHRWNAFLGKDVDATEITENSAAHMFLPRVLEVSFSNACNFMCGYCHPKNSSRFYNEIKKFGMYKDVPSHHCDIYFLKLFEEDNNPYIESFWKWWPQVSLKLKTIRLTGGEPLIQKSTLRLFDELMQNPRPELELSINTNMGIPHQKFIEFCNKLQLLLDAKAVKKIYLYTSVDTWSDHATYIRHGMDFNVFQKNIDHFLKNFPEQKLSFMVTFNIFSLGKFTELLDFWRSLKQKYNVVNNRIKVYINMLTEPIVFSYLLLPEEFALAQFDKILAHAQKNFDETNFRGFNNFVINDIIKVKQDFLSQKLSPEVLDSARREFVLFFKQYDARKNTNLLETFKEYSEVFVAWREKYDPQPTTKPHGLESNEFSQTAQL